MQEYIRFDAEKFLRNSKHWDEDISRLKDELDALAEIGELKSSEVTSSQISKPVERAVLERDGLLSQIRKIEKHKAAFDYAWNKLTDDERYMLNGFFFDDNPIWQFVDDWVEKNASNRQYCYQARREALDHFRIVIEAWYISHDYTA